MHTLGDKNSTPRFMPNRNVYSDPPKDSYLTASVPDSQTLEAAQMPISGSVDKQSKCFFLDLGSVYMVCSFWENSSGCSLMLCDFLICVLYFN